MAKPAILAIRIVSDAKNGSKGIQQAESRVAKFEQRMGKANRAAGVVSAGLVAMGVVAAREASNMQQAAGAVSAVYGKQAAVIEKYARDAATNMGLSRSEYSQTAAVFGAQLKNMGVAAAELAPTTNNLVQLGADLAATFGGSTADAVGAIGSLLRGERDPIERYGVAIKEATIEAEALAMGLVKNAKNLDEIKAKQNKALVAQRAYTDAVKKHGKGSDQALSAEARLLSSNAALEKAMKGRKVELTAEQKAQATLSLLYKQTADAQGQYAREADTAAGSQQTAIAAAKNLAASLGTVLLPVITKVATAAGQAAAWAEKNRTTVLVLAAVIGGLAAAVMAVNLALKVYRATLIVVGVAQAAYNAVSLAGLATNLKWQYLLAKQAIVTRAAAAAQWVMNAAMAANPITLIIIAVIALIAGFVLLYKKSETFRNMIQTAGEWGRTAIGWIVDKTKSLWSWMNTLLSKVGGVKGAISLAFKVSPINIAISAVRRLVGWIKDVVTWVKKIKFPEAPGWMKSVGSFVGGIFGGYTAPGGGARWAAAPRVVGGPGDMRASVGGSGMFRVGGRGGASVNIVVNGYVGDEGKLAREIERLLNGNRRRVGVAA